MKRSFAGKVAGVLSLFLLFSSLVSAAERGEKKAAPPPGLRVRIFSTIFSEL